MSKRWTIKEDVFLASYYEAVGDYAGTHDLGRPKGAADKRVMHLKATGAWAALKMHSASMAAYRSALGLFASDDGEVSNAKILEICRDTFAAEPCRAPASQPDRIAQA